MAVVPRRLCDRDFIAKLPEPPREVLSHAGAIAFDEVVKTKLAVAHAVSIFRRSVDHGAGEVEHFSATC